MYFLSESLLIRHTVPSVSTSLWIVLPKKCKKEIKIHYAVPLTKNEITARQIEDDTTYLIVRPMNCSSYTHIHGDKEGGNKSLNERSSIEYMKTYELNVDYIPLFNK